MSTRGNSRKSAIRGRWGPSASGVRSARYNMPMPSAPTHAVTLTQHPATRSKAVRSIGARAAKGPGASLAISYVIEGAIARMRVPAPRPPRFADGLWQHTCCEVFVACKGCPAYQEFNFSPCGAWAAYAFARYREAAPSALDAPAPRVSVRSAQDKLELDALIDLERLSSVHAHARLALAVVIEDQDGLLSYWALAHPIGAPDFHHPRAFALELE